MTHSTITVPSAKIIRIYDNIIELTLIGREIVRIEDAREIVEGLNQINPEQKVKGYIVNLNHISFITKKARDHFRAHPELEAKIAGVVILANNPLARLFGSYFLGQSQPKDTEVRMMKNRQEGLDWLQKKLAVYKNMSEGDAKEDLAA